MRTPNELEGSGGSARSRRAKGVTITVRLFPEVHGAVLGALARVPCGSRSARVIHLLTIGLMYEHSYASQRAGSVSAPLPGMSRGPGADTPVLGDEDLAFVSGLIEGTER